ncbi:MAG: 16S rRNA (cytosine(1402)-N(4))-methyltransferase [Bacteroidia bacterium]|nr:MAG: 16S rRNA (cytosine(1402)-N(4))-methyltransferase [Bacteroidia bacterium]
MSTQYHIPVLLKEAIEGLNIKPSGIYVDLTFGGGGHSREILKRLDSGKLLALDQDADTRKNAEAVSKEFDGNKNFSFYHSNFTYISRLLRYENLSKVDGILVDLGVSSHQFDQAHRGFSFRLGGRPDMRMNRHEKKSAFEILNEYSEEELSRILYNYGELKNARRIAQTIVNHRKISDLRMLTEILKQSLNLSREHKITAQVCQALRMETNQEQEKLHQMLLQTEQIIKPGGRLVVISYHSLEDRPVKNYMKFGNIQGENRKDIYGNTIKPFEELNKKVITPSPEEIAQNNRARSAKLRIAQKV